jgi:hypothetical protein
MGTLRGVGQISLGILASVGGVLAIARFVESVYRALTCCRAAFSWSPISEAMTLVLQLAVLMAAALYARSRL